MLGHNELIREGFAWVGVSAQAVGVDALKATDPLRGDAARYANLSHPGDSYSYDIFSQAGQAIRDDAPTMLGGLKPKHFIAIGESQSAGRLVTYIDARASARPRLRRLPRAQPDGGCAHPRRRRRAGARLPDRERRVRFSNGAARQDDSDTYRLWEVAGTAHFDQYGLSIGPEDTGDGQGGVAVMESMQHPTNQPSEMFTCGAPINTGPAHYVLDAAFHHLNRWVSKGIAPPSAPRLQTTPEVPSHSSPTSTATRSAASAPPRSTRPSPH